jgi:Predicted permeases
MSIKAILLGIAQDAGVPQVGCYCANCSRAWADPDFRQFVACLGLVDHTNRQSWLIDATPDFREQLHALHNLAPDCALAGIVLTHAHTGHYAGLIHLGREAMNARGLPVYATPCLANFLHDNAPWSQLVALRNIELRLLVAGFIDAIGGGGWGPIATPSLILSGNEEPRQVVGSINLVEFFVTVAETLTFLITVGPEAFRWDIIVALLIGGAIAAPVAAFLCKKLPQKALGGLIGVALIGFSIRTIFRLVM